MSATTRDVFQHAANGHRMFASAGFNVEGDVIESGDD
jgi:hypothetical protein